MLARVGNCSVEDGSARMKIIWPLPVSHRHLVIERSRVAVSPAREVSVIVGYQFSRGGWIGDQPAW